MTRSRLTHPLRAALVLTGAILIAACGGETQNPSPEPNPDPPDGATSFVSADGRNGEETAEDDADAGAMDGDREAGGDDRTVEEGDIYRVLGGNLILNLNAYRGVQVIDFSDVSAPEIIGRLQISGTPVEMYVVDDVAYVLMNNWYGYYGTRGDVMVDRTEGGIVLAVDISDPNNPVDLGRALVPGYIQTSRLTRGSDASALYVVGTGWDEWETADGGYTWESRTYVRSFDVSGGALEQRSDLDLGGYVADIAATPDALLVARNDWSRDDASSRVAVVDISDPNGTMAEGDEVVAAGYVNSQFNMDLYEGVLRIVSTDSWNGTTNHLETFDATDLTNITPIDHDTFGDGQSLFATIFLGNKAFFVTYLRQDPFHAFYIGDDGQAEERNEFIVSGWNDFFRPVFDETRLIGIGVNDENGGRNLAVSLYDITDLDNTNPMLARAEIDALDWGWSEANWDHRAFSVLQGAVDVTAADGTREQGMVLLPYSGWDDDEDRYVTAVQIFTFSETTLTRRGEMIQGTHVRRSFLADDEVTANLGEAELSLYDHTNPDEPVELGRVDLAPNYVDLITFGDYRARVHRRADYWGYNNDHIANDTIEIVPTNANPDTADAVASFEVPGGADVHRSGDMLVAVQMRVTDYSEWPYDYESTVVVYDLTDPANPTEAGTLITDQLAPYYGGGYYGGWYEDADCFDCRGYGYWGGNQQESVFPVEDGIAFLAAHDQQELLGTEEVCNTYIDEEYGCYDNEEDCTYYSGGISCRSLNGEEPYCSGSYYECGYEDGDWGCEEIDPAGLDLRMDENCYEYERYRYWQSFSLEVIDLSNPADPTIADSVGFPDEFEGVSAVQDGNSVFVTYKVPYEVEDDSRPYVRYFFEEVDLTDPADPELGRPVNVPGQLIAVNGDELYTQDTVWGDDIVETAVARLELHDNLAYLQAWHRFEDQQVYSLMLDGAGHVLASHRTAWLVAYDNNSDYEGQMLSILDSADLALRSTVEVDSWATLQDAAGGRALFQAPGGALLFNVDNPAAPYAQAFFPIRGWSSDMFIDGDDIILPAGRYGIYRFDADTFNLLPPL